MQKLKCALVLGLTFAAAQGQTAAPALDKNQKDRGLQMLHDVADAMKKHYYDTANHGIDMAAKMKAAETAIQNAANNSQVFGAIASTLQDLNDSHTFFLPPARATHRDFGYLLRMVGDNCYVTNVRPGSDASEKLTPGDRVLLIEGTTPTRGNLWAINYAYNQLYAPTSLRLKIARPDGTEKLVDVAAKLRQDKRVLDLTSENDFWQMVRDDENDDHYARQRMVEFGDALIVWKMPQFDLDSDEVDKQFKIIRRHQTLVLDLRGNGGGLVSTLQDMVSALMDHEVTIATRTGRKAGLKPIVAKKRGGAFTGKVIVLIDSRSGSASELLARVVQLEHRGTVMGDLSSGSVMESMHYSFSDGANTKIFYGASITDADLKMADGNSLEHVGVTPEEQLLPLATDLAAGRDPVLTKAMKLAGVDLDPAAAFQLFPYEWRKN